MMEWNRSVPGLKEAAALAMNEYNWTPARTLLEVSVPKDSVEYTQLQQIHVNDNIIRESCSRGFTELVSILLKNGFQVDYIVYKSTGKRMLHLAAGYGHLSLVKLLLSVGAVIDCKMCDGKTPLFLAVQKRHLEVVKHLISVGADINTCDKDALTLLDAEYYYIGDEEMLQLLLESGCDPNKCRSRLLVYNAVFDNEFNRVRMLLEARANVNGMDTKNIPLQSAVLDGNIPMMQLLLEYGADINITNQYDNTALHLAVKKNLQSVKFLIEHGSLINSVNKYKQTPLLVSIIHREFDIAILLINSGADLNLCIHDRVLNKALDEDAPVELIECLLEHGAMVYGTALLYVIFYSNYSNDCRLQIAKLLLIYGSVYHVKDYLGSTLLHWACRMGDVELVEYLIHYGLNVDAKNREGQTPCDIAREKGHTNIVKAIIHYHCNKYTNF